MNLQRVVLPLLCLLAPSAAFAAYEDLGVGARAPGMGNAFVAVADDVYAIHYNPAGLGTLERPQLGAAYTKLYLGLTDKSDLGTSFLGYAHPLKEGRYGTVATAWNAFTLNNIYREDTFYFSYGRLLFTSEQGGELNGGMSLKYLHSSFGALPEANTAVRWDGGAAAPDPVLSGSNSQGAFALDMGFLYRFAKHYSAGIQFANINQPNVAFSSGESDKVPFGLKAAFNYRSLVSNLVAQLESQESPTGSRDNILTFAAERWFPKLMVGDFGARGGLGFGSREFAQISMGLSYRVRRFVLDYGFGIPLKGVSSTSGSHRVALTFRFGRPTDEEETLEMVLEAMRSLKSQAAPVRLRVEGAGLSQTERATLEEHLAHGRLLEMSGRYQDALDKYEQALKIAPRDKDLLVHSRRLGLVASRFPQLTEYRTDPVQAALHQGFKSYFSGQDQAAVDKLTAALELKPGDRDVEDLLDAIEKESGLRRSAPLPERRSASYGVAAKLTRAETAVEERRYGEAIELCQDVLREDSENVEAWQILGTAYFALKDFEASLDAWRRAYELQKSPSLRAAIKGHIRSIERLREKRPRTVEEQPPTTVVPAPVARPKLSPQEIQALYDKGVEYYLRRDLENAQKMFDKILESDPFNAEAGKAMRRIREEKP